MDVASRRNRRPPLDYGPIAILLCALSAFTGVAKAVDFDVSVKAPMVKAAPELKSLAENYSADFARLAAASPLEMVTNKTLFLKRFELKWLLTRAVDERLPLDELAAIGLVKREDGGLEVDLNAFPQWNSFTDALVALMPAMNLEVTGPLLINRGFRESDVVAIRTYLANHDLRAAAAANTLPVALSFSKLVKKHDKLKLGVGKDLVYSFLYQREKAEAMAQRDWAEGLLRTLDAQRVRILHSFFDEMTHSSVLGPNDAEAGVAGVLALMRLPDYEQRAIADAKGVTP
jgi:hypothetical protein